MAGEKPSAATPVKVEYLAWESCLTDIKKVLEDNGKAFSTSLSNSFTQLEQNITALFNNSNGEPAAESDKTPSGEHGLCTDVEQCATCRPQVEAVWNHAQEHFLAVPGIREVLEAHMLLSQEVDLSNSPRLQALMQA